MDELFATLMGIFSLPYIVSVVILTWLLIKLVDVLHKGPQVKGWAKRLLTALSGLVLGVVFKLYTDTPIVVLVPSFLLSVFVYDTAIKFLIDRLKWGYKK